MEEIFISVIDQDDWFKEWERYEDDEDFQAISSIPTSAEDDTFNHIDLISVISNSTTDHQPIPFAIDITYNADFNNNKSLKNLAKKFHWKHVYGKSAIAPENVSEFGKVFIKHDAEGNRYLSARALPLECRKGLKIPGFGAAKYYYDSGSTYPGASTGCRINLMPRFIVGFNPELTDKIKEWELNKDKEYRVWQYGNTSNRDADRQEYEKVKSRAKWCMLTELSEQADGICRYLENLPELKWTPQN